ncbi:Predicted arabinose efflux permease, MFS family [Dyella jiangningensis]|uniref:MFS transporter n=1 Tax=Dyella sp. AtDHG13 TaxID=1938897 RepID=UPI0008834E79|nr:MFS transporter [Dyella sp. AtDHG13]PXV60485.1 putative MFS family arabinose efflux permease [Dyella sp. AtDHG13]SDJ47474.1 Predicted arabinose efflux permease, MFS family [Dyella jiangningensis]
MTQAISSAAALAPERRLGARDIQTLLLASLGGALEFYDFVVFVFFALPLSHLFFPQDTAPWLAQLQVYGIFAAGYLARPLGGIVMAHFGDRQGRKRMFTLSVFLMALPTLAIGLLPVYASIGLLAPLLLLVMRVVQGVAIGGEVPGAWVFVAEHAPRGRVGFACACLTSGLTVGILIGSLTAAWINHHLAPAEVLAWGWRLPFLLGGVFGFIAVWLRRWLSETPVFAQLRERKALSRELPLRSVMASHGGSVALSMAVTWMLTAAILVLILMLPSLVQKSFGIAPDVAFLGNSIAAFCLGVGCIAFGWLVDRIGAAWALLLGSVALVMATYGLFGDLAAGGAHFLPLYALTGFLVGTVAVVPTIMVAAFPAPIRYSGISFAYNVAYAVFGASTATLIGYLAERAGRMAPAHYVCITAVVSVLVALWLLAKGRGRGELAD